MQRERLQSVVCRKLQRIYREFYIFQPLQRQQHCTIYSSPRQHHYHSTPPPKRRRRARRKKSRLRRRHWMRRPLIKSSRKPHHSLQLITTITITAVLTSYFGCPHEKHGAIGKCLFCLFNFVCFALFFGFSSFLIFSYPIHNLFPFVVYIYAPVAVTAIATTS